MAENKFDLQAFLNDPKVQANKPAAIRYLQSKGIIDPNGNPIAGSFVDTSKKESGGIGGFLKGLISAPATILARPFQAASDLGDYLGTKIALKGKTPEEQSAIIAADNERQQKKQTESSGPGKIIAPTPSSFGDVKKDVGRAIQTVALGAGPESLVAGGAALGLGGSLEQGNDLFSVQTALQTALGAGAGKVLGLIGKPIFNVAGKVIGEITPTFLKDLASKGDQAILKFASEHEILPDFVKNATDKIGQKISNIGTVAKDAVASEFKGSTADQVVNNLKNRALGIFEGKTQAEILATPEAEIYKLSPSERSFYYDTQKTAISEKAAQAEAQVKSNLKIRTEAAQAEAEKLNRQIVTASRDEVISLRPKIRTALGEQSQEYRRLVDEEIAPHRDTAVTSKEMSDLVDSKFSDDPVRASAIKKKLGISPDTNPDAETTVGKLYDQTKTLGQDIGTGAKKSARVYTPDEKLTDDAIHTLTDLMKQKGVDLSGARVFWARYAPIRNQLIAEAKPFVISGVQTKTFANTLTRVVAGKDVNNEIFIQETEKLLGQSIGQDTKAALAKLSTNAKETIANELEAEAQKAEINLQKQKALNKWSEKEFEIERASTKRKIIINTFKTVGAIAGYAEVKHVLPFLPLP